ncbi:Flp family type IVb pilin [Arthrobacter sp. EH-1B-1]|uniref:Flp family type IVb pilin n=1 Tax=Arthrobacter vasquezii TaxID=2977629 RepID=A0ABT6CYS1_9MICC|nr:Flp family type IVb pilin [Arthrobacter vasquezii]MDF9279235.1 Flp family type IVb pilin [Arthrobacter vasquezii]
MFNNFAAYLGTLASIVKARASRDETGATAVEYGIMVALIAVAIIVAVTALGGGLDGLFDRVTGKLTPLAP